MQGFLGKSVSALSVLAAAACAPDPVTEPGNPDAETTPAITPEETGTAQIEPDYLRAEIRANGSLWLTQWGSSTRPLAVDAYRLLRADGSPLPLSAALPASADEIQLFPSVPVDIRRVHYVEIPSLGLRARVRFDGWFRSLYSDKPLGANIAPDGSHTEIRVFAPRADRVRIYLYENADDAPEDALESREMTRDAQGVFEARFEGDRHGVYYDFTAHGPADPGSRFYGTHPVHLSDPYARVNAEATGKSRIWRATTPAAPLSAGRPAMQDVIAYEVHVQDFTDLLPNQAELGSSIPAMVESGLTNSRGEAIGFDHIVDLGINVVHLLPVQEFIHRDPATWQANYGDVEMMQRMGIAEEDYQWGYRTTHPFAIETRFRQAGTEHGAQRDQFRDLVQAFHDRGIAVIIDLVPNHTGETMDGREDVLNYNAFAPFYYYRLGENGEHIGAFGNEVKTEDRPMVQRWLIDQCRHLIEEFGIDGFRIDLAGQVDEQTLQALRVALGDDVIIYGEPWIDSNDPFVAANPDWDWYKEDAPITFFQDDSRNALVGSPFVLENPATDLGYSGGNTDLRADAMRAIANAWPTETESPNQGLNYMDIHDNWTLADRFALTDWDGRQGVNEPGYRVAAGFLLTSLGPVVIHGGSEFMRSKGIAPLHETFVDTPAGPFQIKGREDTYNVRTPNQFIWENVGATGDDGATDYAGMHAWWRGLIAFRNSEAGSVFRIADVPPDGYFQWFTPENDPALLGYLVDDRVLVLANVGPEAGRFSDLTLPDGSWRQIADGQQIDPQARFAERPGGRADFDAPAQSFQIWVRD